MSEPRTADKRSAPDIPIVLSHPAPVWRRAILLMLLCLTLAVIASSRPIYEALLYLLRACQEVIAAHPFLGPAVFIVFAAASAMLAFVSVALIVPIAVFSWGAPLTVVYLWLGWLLGGLFNYLAGRFVGRSLLLWLSPAATTRFEHLILHHGSLGLVVLLQISLPSEFLGYALGSARFELRKYVLALALSEAPYAVGVVVMGASFIERRSGVLIGCGLLLGALIIAAFSVLRRRVQTASARLSHLPDSPAARTGTHS